MMFVIFFQRDTVHTIREALPHMTHPQLIEMTHYSRPGVAIDTSQRVLIDALPSILVLYVKRFCYDANVGGVVKVMKQVRFGPELDLECVLYFFFSSFAVGKEENVGLILCRYDSTNSWEAVTVIKILSIRRYSSPFSCL